MEGKIESVEKMSIDISEKVTGMSSIPGRKTLRFITVRKEEGRDYQLRCSKR